MAHCNILTKWGVVQWYKAKVTFLVHIYNYTLFLWAKSVCYMNQVQETDLPMVMVVYRDGTCSIVIVALFCGTPHFSIRLLLCIQFLSAFLMIHRNPFLKNTWKNSNLSPAVEMSHSIFSILRPVLVNSNLQKPCCLRRRHVS